MPGVQVDFDEILASPKFIHREAGFLSGPASEQEILNPRTAQTALKVADDDPHRPIKRFIDENAELFGHGADLLSSASITREFVTEHSGMRTVVWEQQLDGIPIFEAVLYGHIARNGELVSLCSQFMPDPARAADTGVRNRLAIQVAPPVPAEAAVAVAGRDIGERIDAREVYPVFNTAPEGAEKQMRFNAAALQGETIASLVWLPLDRNTMRLCWRVLPTGRTRGELYEVLVDAETGEPQVRHCWTAYLSPASYRIFAGDSPTPMSPGWSTPSAAQPAQAAQADIEESTVRSLTASPNGWINDGVTWTVGNNVDAHLDLYNRQPPYNYQFVVPPRPQRLNRVFDYTWNAAEPPLPVDQSQYPNGSPNQNAAVVNAFYWCNWMHDRLYDLGFTEGPGNFVSKTTSAGVASEVIRSWSMCRTPPCTTKSLVRLQALSGTSAV